MKSSLKATVKEFDSSKHGGAPMLGLKGLVVKTHGSSGRNGDQKLCDSVHILQRAEYQCKDRRNFKSVILNIKYFIFERKLNYGIRKIKRDYCGRTEY